MALRVYCTLPFGKLDARSPEIVQIAEQMGRTPGALAMKTCNLASLDPVQRKRGIVGLQGASRADRALWERFLANPEEVAVEAEAAFEAIAATADSSAQSGADAVADAATEGTAKVRVRRVQGFFRRSVLAAYGNRCAISGLEVPELLRASHIIPWAKNVRRRADPTNGIALNALYDCAFDRGLITIDADMHVMVSARLMTDDVCPFHVDNLQRIVGRTLLLPHRFAPDPAALKYHREHIYAS